MTVRGANESHVAHLASDTRSRPSGAQAQRLADRLRDGSGDDPGLDAELADSFGIDLRWSKHLGTPAPMKRYTRSLEHAAWFFAQVLPGWDWNVGFCGGNGRYVGMTWPPNGFSDFGVYAPTAARALLAVAMTVYAQAIP